MCSPGDHRVEHHRGPIGQGVLVIASRDPAPLLDVTVAAFDDGADAGTRPRRGERIENGSVTLFSMTNAGLPLAADATERVGADRGTHNRTHIAPPVVTDTPQ